MKYIFQVIYIFGLLSLTSPLFGETKTEAVLKSQKSGINANVTSQKKVDKIEDERQTKLDLYRRTTQEAENLKIYNDQMMKMIASQTEEMTSIHTKIEDIQKTSKEIIPLMIDMVSTLSSFVELDTPFLPSERTSRVKELTKLMDRADVTTSEKYRRILEAYQIEAEYGQSIEAYKDTILLNGTKKTVDLLRVGRIGLYYVTLDGSEAGVWSKTSKNWQSLNRSEAHNLVKAVKVAKKESAPSLLNLSIAKAEVL